MKRARATGGIGTAWAAVGMLACAGQPTSRPVPSSRAGVEIDLAAEADDRRACGGCHEPILAEWDASQHRGAWSDAVFQSGYAVDRQPECRQCHAPLNRELRDPEPSSVAAHNGVSCRSCPSRRRPVHRDVADPF